MKSFLEYKKVVSLLNLKIQSSKNYVKAETKLIRNPNFPSELSENLVKFVEKKLSNRELQWNKGSDLLSIDNKRYEVKCFVSGPSTFSSKLFFDSIFFLDARYSHQGIFILYKIECDGNIFKRLNVNSTHTFLDFEKTGKRPRCNFFFLLSQLRKTNIKVSYYYVVVKKDISVKQIEFPV